MPSERLFLFYMHFFSPQRHFNVSRNTLEEHSLNLKVFAVWLIYKGLHFLVHSLCFCCLQVCFLYLKFPENILLSCVINCLLFRDIFWREDLEDCKQLIKAPNLQIFDWYPPMSCSVYLPIVGWSISINVCSVGVSSLNSLQHTPCGWSLTKGPIQ